MVNLKSIKTQLIIFLSAFALYLSFKDNDAIFLLTTLIAVISAIGVESVMLLLKSKKLAITDSSIISGLIIGYVLSSDNPWWIFLLASFLAISSKHLIHFNRKHLFNPAAFGIFLTIVLFGASTQWRGTYMWYILLPFGLYFISKIQKLEVIIGYGLAGLGLFGIQAVAQKTPLLNIFGYLNYFYIFIMMIEPKTTPIKKRGKFIFGVSVAVLIFILTEFGVRFDAELCALLLSNLAVPLLNKL
jgi:Na+-translocating ferredoxin:NAD+ oxidoreductase RnfD subunit